VKSVNMRVEHLLWITGRYHTELLMLDVIAFNSNDCTTLELHHNLESKGKLALRSVVKGRCKRHSGNMPNITGS
jgi:hypothetical protein